MPELAEVETVKRVLSNQVLNNKIKSINILYPKIIEKDSLNLNKILGKSINSISRKGKYLIFDIDKYYLISHLRMEGKYFIKPCDEEINKHEHIIFNFDTFSLRYHDTRKFGRMCLIDKKEFNLYFKNIGPDCNSNIDPNYLITKLNKSNLAIKTLLLDQSIIAGLGNIYVDEVLFASRINPHKKGKDININDVNNIINSSKIILNKAIKYKGTTIRSYTSSLNVYGSYQKFLQVHTKYDLPCPICKTKISKCKIGGRTTYFCNNCQK